MTKRRSETETEISLHLIPRAIARQINKKGGKVYRISVKRTHWHHCSISLRTKSLPRELRARCDECPPPACQPLISRDDRPGDDPREGEMT